MAVPLLGARWVPSQVFTEITAATCVGKMALDPSPSLLPPAAPPIAVAARCLAVASEELEEDRGEKKENGADQGRYWLISTAQPS